MTLALDRLIEVARAAAPVASLDEWRARHERVTAGLARPIERALVGGAAMDRIGYAFASGYRSALEALVPGLAVPAVLAATEVGGAHPRAIQTRMARQGDGWRLDGVKAWCTLGPHAEELLVVATQGEDDAGRPKLKVVRVSPRAAGVTSTVLPDLPFVPEIPHASLTLDGVVVDARAVLPGDGYADYLKPFRTTEDLHVFAAFTGQVATIALAHRGADVVLERSLALAAGLLALAAAAPSAASAHLALASLLREGRALADEAAALLAPEVAARWQRDVPLLSVAGKARQARLEAARASIRGA